ncbi:MAG: c-type cytochrome [Rhodocyclaceae bacterium]|nr:c-type cytochrome [Rhodocyclaceae bacterium]
MRSRGVSCALLTSGLLLAAAGAQAGASTPAMLSNACAGCHGTHGESAGPSMPSLAGQSKAAIVTAMKEFKGIPKKDAEGKPVLDKDGKPVLETRTSTVMGRLAKGYTDAEIEAMGDFFAGQKHHSPAQAVDKAKVAKGAELQEKHCIRCHVEDGKEGKDNSPIMAGQWLKYLQVQMDLYTGGQRKMSEKMAEKVKPLSKEELDAVLHFYASVK